MMTDEQRCDLALSFWTLAFQYLTLAENASRETASQGNIHIMTRDFKDGPITPEQYDEGTRWSDHRIVVSLLFNLLHGIELLVKGFLIVDPAETVEKLHNLSDLSSRFRNKYPSATILTNFFAKYTTEDEMPTLLRRFLSDNGLGVNMLYKALRYPSDDFSTMRIFTSLKYRGEDGTSFFCQLSSEIRDVRLAAVRLARELPLVMDDCCKSVTT